MRRLAGGPRGPYYVLDAIDRHGGRIGWRDLEAATHLETEPLQKSILACKGRSWIAVRTPVRGSRAKEYTLTPLGREILTAYRSGQVVVLRFQARENGLDRLAEYRRANRFLFRHDP